MSDYLNQRLLQKLGLVKKEDKKPKPIPAKSKKRIAQEAEEKKAGKKDALDQWFEDRREEMTGKCVLCGGASEKHNDDLYRYSIHHLLEKGKKQFPSVKLVSENWLEVCHFQNCCHSNLHNGHITWELLYDSAEWAIIREKLLIVLPQVAESERSNKLYSKLVAMVHLKQGHEK